MGGDYVIDYGLKLTKREYFAGLAMQGIIASDANYPDRKATGKLATEYADALLAALEVK